MTMRARASRQRGAMLIEVLVAVVVCAFALLGFAAMQARATTAEFEALQRSQALLLVEDMAARIAANRANAADYVLAGAVGDGALEDCTDLSGAALDLCEWGNLIRGSTEERGGQRVGSMLAARGCIVRAAGGSDRYVVAVAWLGVVPTGGAASPCGAGDEALADEALRRAVASTVCVGRLRDPALPVAGSRC
jgi:type IV pilus assembly protein PilV